MNKEYRLTRMGIQLGGLVPVVATFLDFYFKNLEITWANLLVLYQQDMLLWIILTTPLAIGFIFNYFARQVKAREDNLIADRNQNHEELTKLEGFIFDIENGDYSDKPYHFSDTRVAGLLTSLKNKLQRQKSEDERGRWTAEGLSRFGELFREEQDVEKLCNRVVSELVKYTGMNQGSVFMVGRQEDDSEILELKACYAYNRKKFEYGGKRIEPGEGLVGQCFLERNTIVLRDVPGNFIKITSGLGEATPRHVLLIPICTNDTIEGVIELAGFHVVPDHYIRFMEKVAEGFATVLHTVKVNQETRALLEATQQQAEQLRTQEEEMRQNMEELQAVQEAMERKMQESMAQEEELRQNLEELNAMQDQLSSQLEESRTLKQLAETREHVLGLTTILSETDLFGTITYVNDKFCEVARYSREELMGKPHNIVRHPDMPKPLFKLFWETIRRGEVFRGIVKNKAKDGSAYWVDATIVPIKDAEGTILKYVGARYHIRDEKIALKLYNEQALILGFPQLPVPNAQVLSQPVQPN